MAFKYRVERIGRLYHVTRYDVVIASFTSYSDAIDYIASLPIRSFRHKKG